MSPLKRALPWSKYLVFASILAVPTIQAATVDLTACDSSVSSCPGGAKATVSEVLISGSQIDLSIVGDNGWQLFDGGIFGFNYSLPGSTITDVIINTPNVQANTTGSSTIDGFGSFAYKFQESDTSLGTIPSVSLTITGTNLSLSGFNVTPDFAAHVKWAGTAACPIGTTSCTMFVSTGDNGGGGGQGTAPEPATWVLLGTALSSIGILRRRFSRSA